METQTANASANANEIRNVVFIGETGSGKSSVINLIAGGPEPTEGVVLGPTHVSSDATPCTVEFASYDVSIEGRLCRLWDTPGLNQPSRFRNLFRRSTSTRARASLERFLQERQRRRELDLLVFCVRGGGRVHAGTLTAYNRFCRPTLQKTVIPVVFAITHLEKQQPTMDAWWQHNQKEFDRMGLACNGYACITCLSPHHRRWASHEEICNLILEQCQSRPQSTPVSDMEYLDDPQRCVVC